MSIVTKKDIDFRIENLSKNILKKKRIQINKKSTLEGCSGEGGCKGGCSGGIPPFL